MFDISCEIRETFPRSDTRPFTFIQKVSFANPKDVK